MCLLADTQKIISREKCEACEKGRYSALRLRKTGPEVRGDDDDDDSDDDGSMPDVLNFLIRSAHLLATGRSLTTFAFDLPATQPWR